MMNDKDQHDRGLKLRTEMFGREAVEKRMNAFGEFGKPLQHIINAYAYGDVWSRHGLAAADQVARHGGDDGGRGTREGAGRAHPGRLEERLHA